MFHIGYFETRYIMTIKRIVLLLLSVTLGIKVFSYDFQSGGIYYNIKSSNEVEVTYKSPSNRGYSGVISIPQSVKYNGIEYNVTSINDNTFASCTGLTGTLNIPNSIITIGEAAFYNCTGFTGSLTIPNSVTTIGKKAFYGCSGLTGLLSMSTSIGDYAFYGCTNISSIDLPNVKEIGDFSFFKCSSVKSITFSDVLTTIGKSSFNGCKLLQSVQLPNSVSVIGENAFQNCEQLINVTLSNALTEIESYSFYGCGFNSIEIPSSVTKINSFAFQNCQSLQTIEIPDNVIAINTGAFSGCSALHEIYLPKSLTTISESLFYSCSSLSAIIIPDHVTTIESTAFRYCTNLSSIQLPSSLLKLGRFSFADCIGLTQITIPKNVNSIGNYCFSGCNNLMLVKSEMEIPCVLEGNFFYGNTKPNATLQVPRGTKEAYLQSSYGWGNIFSTIIEAPIIYQLSLNSKGSGGITYLGNVICNASGVFEIDEGSSASLVFTPDEGYQLSSLKVNNTDVTAKVKNNKYTISKIAANTIVEVVFEAIPPTTYSLTITASGNGSAIYGSDTIKQQTQIFTVEEGTSATISFTPDNGYRIASVKVNNSDVIASVTNSQYTISNISANTTLDVVFEAIPPTTNTLSVIATGNGKIVCPEDVEVRNETKTFQVEEESEFNCQVVPDEGFSYVISCTAAAAGGSWTGRGNNYTVQGIKKDTELKVSFKILSFSLSITASGNGSVSYSTATIKNQTKSYNIEYDKSATVSFTPDNGYRIASVKVNGNDVTASVTNGQYTISNIKEDKSLEVLFEAIPATTFNLEIKSTGNGYALYNGTVVRSKATSFAVNSGTAVQITFVPDDGYRVASVKANNTDVTTSIINNRYSINSSTEDVSVEVVFEEIPPTTYSLTIKATGNGSVTYDSMTLSNKTQKFTVNEGSYASLVISPENGYRLKSILVDGKDVTSELSNNLYTVSNITKDTGVEVEFEAIPIPTYTLTVTATGNGSATVGDATIKNRTQKFTLNEGTDVIVIFTPDNGNSIKSIKVNDADNTASVTGNRYVIEGLTANTKIEVTFVEDINALTVDGVNYSVISQSEKTIKLMGGNIGQMLTVPATITQNETTWKVTDIDKEALKNNSELAAIIWNPEVAFTATVSNPNLLLYVKDEQYAPEGIRNVVVNGFANEIALFDAASGNGFYCPQAFTALVIVYAHRYSMETGVGTSKGWETITLPFDVQSINHQTKGAIKPFATWKEGDTSKPFWLYELTGNGFVEAEGIKAYTPYIISMPYNPKYNEEWQLNGEVKFSAYNVTIESTDDLKTASFKDRTFIPNFIDKAANEGFFGLNVVNDYSSNNSGMIEGSKFVLNMRQIHPFEAYMTTTSNSRHAIGIFDDMTTAIHEIETKMEAEQDAVFDLQGRRMNVPKKGVYIKNGKKYIKK